MSNLKNASEEELLALWELSDYHTPDMCLTCIHREVQGHQLPCRQCSELFAFRSDKSHWELSFSYIRRVLEFECE